MCRRRQKNLIKAARGKKSLPDKGGDLPVSGVYPFSCLGVTSEAFGDALSSFIQENADDIFTGKCQSVLDCL